jgi:hypothetical protein
MTRRSGIACPCAKGDPSFDRWAAQDLLPLNIDMASAMQAGRW